VTSQQLKRTNNPRLDRKRRLPPLALIALTLLTFMGVITCDFSNWDDTYTVANDPGLNPPTWAALGRHWKRADMDIYMPLTQTVWAGIATVARVSSPDEAGVALNPYPFHLANLIAHIAAVLLVYSILQSLGCRPIPAAIGAGLFAVHSVQVESVAWVSGLKDVLCGLFCLCALRLWIVPSSRSGWFRSVAACFAYLLALLAKPSAITLPLIAAAVAIFLLRWPVSKTTIRLLPWIALAVVFAIIARRAQPADNVPHPPLSQRPLIAADVVWFYARKIIWPGELGIDYGKTPSAILFQGPLLLAAKLVALVVPLAVALVMRRRFPALLASIAIFIAAICPVLGLVPFDFQEYSTAADHYLYVAMLGPALLVASLVQLRPGWLVRTACVVWIAMLGLYSFRQTTYWKNGISLMEHAIAVNPQSWVSHLNLSNVLLPASPARALTEAKQACSLRPDNALCYRALTNALLATNQPQEALKAAQEAVRLRPWDAATQIDLGRAFDAAGDWTNAVAAYRKSLEFDPANPDATCNLAAILAEHGQLNEAIRLYQAALREYPNLAAARTGLANAQAARLRG
jgi:tetratricopeptide (TPR) repeat protein